MNDSIYLNMEVYLFIAHCILLTTFEIRFFILDNVFTIMNL